MNLSQRLLTATADVGSLPSSEGSSPSAIAQAEVGRTAPGQLLAARESMLAMQTELAVLRNRLEQFDGSMPTVRLDPKSVHESRWANRHSSAYSTPAFERLKASVANGGGNTQPILVREREGGGHEVVFGHRRRQACAELGLPVLAVIWNAPMADQELLASMDRENREREDPSPYEQGVTYQAALNAGLFPSQRRLAEALGVSHTWVGKALSVAALPQEVVDAFATPLDIQPRHAEEIRAALEQDAEGVVSRARSLRSTSERCSAGRVVEALTGRGRNEDREEGPISVDGRVVGAWRAVGQRQAVFTLELRATRDIAGCGAVADAVASILQGINAGHQ